MAVKKYRVLITNPVSKDGLPDVVIKGVVAKAYIVVPVEVGVFEIYYGKQYLGEATTQSQIRKLIERDGAEAPVLIQNPNGGYEQMPFKYKSPSSNPKRKTKKKAKKRKAKRKTKKSTKRKTKKKAKTSGRKKKRVSKAKKTVKKAKKKVKKAKKKVKSAKKKVSKAKKGLRKAKGALGKAKRSKNPGKPTSNPHKKRRRKKVAKKVERRPATVGDINAYVKRVTGTKF